MILYHKWMNLPLGTRYQIAADFGIEKKGATEVDSNYIKSDGFLIKEIEEALNVKAIQGFLSTTEEDIAVLFDMLVDHYAPIRNNQIINTNEGIAITPKKTWSRRKKV